MKHSTNALTARYCRSKGWLCDTVQRFYGGKRHDLFGIADSIVVRGTHVLWVQNACYGSLKAHRDQIDQSEVIQALDAAGVRCEIWEWRRKRVGRKKLWFLRTQRRSSYGGVWDELQDWQGPFEL